MEIPGMAKVKTRLMARSGPMPDCHTSIAPLAQADGGRSHQSEHGPGGAGGHAVGLHQHDAEGPREEGGEIESGHPGPAQGRLQHLSEPGQDQHVEGDVQDAVVDEPGGDEPVPLAGVDRRGEEGEAQLQFAAPAEGAAGQGGEQEHADVDGDDDPGDEGAGSGVPASGPLGGRGPGGPDALPAVGAHRRVVEAVGAGRAPTAGARPAGLPVAVVEARLRFDGFDGSDGFDGLEYTGRRRPAGSPLPSPDAGSVRLVPLQGNGPS
jgi:hypothetical protein